MDYDNEIYTELAMKLLEGDIRFIASRYHIPGYDQDDLRQELRMLMWKQIPKFDHTRGVLMRTWASTLMRNRLKNMSRESQAKKRWNGKTLPICDDFSFFYEKDTDCQKDLEGLLDRLHENNMTLEDFF